MRCTPVLILLVGFAVSWLGTRQAAGYPYQGLRPTDDVMTGPTDADLSALHWNPAALGLMSGAHIKVHAGAVGYLGNYQADTSLPAGFSGAGDPGGPAPAVPIRWIAPNSLVAASWDLGSESITLSVGFYTPYVDRTNYLNGDLDPAHQPTRYHALADLTYSLWGAAGVSVRAASWLYVGGGFNFAWTRNEVRYLRDPAGPDPNTDDGLPCGGAGSSTGGVGSGPCQQWRSRQEIDLDVNAWGYGFTAGALYIPRDNWWIGAAFVSSLITSGGAQVSLDGFPDPARAAPPACPETWRGARVFDARKDKERTCGGADMILSFPHLLNVGVRTRLRGHRSAAWWRPRTLEVASWLRLSFPPRNLHEQLLQRRAFPLLPDEQIRQVGPRVAGTLEVDVRELWPHLSLAQALLYETPRTDPDAVSPANLDGHKLDATFSARLRVVKELWFTASVGLTYVFFGGGAGQGFRSDWATACRESNYDVTSQGCRRVQDGWALPAATGSYTLALLHGAAGFNLQF